MTEQDHSHYLAMREFGADPLHVFLEGERRGLDPIARIRMVRAVFGLSLEDAKRMLNYADTGRCDGRWGWLNPEALACACAFDAAAAGDEPDRRERR